MERYTDLEEFAKGGRISPERSATEPPKGTLMIGLNDNVWINVPDKNGRLSWKPTEFTNYVYSFIGFGYADDESIDFKIENNWFNWKLRYLYNQKSYTYLQYEDGGNSYETEGSLEDCQKFFEDYFDVEKYNSLTKTDLGKYLQGEVRQLFGHLRYLINNKGLRTPETPEPPKEKPSWGKGKLMISVNRNLKLFNQNEVLIPYLETENFERFIPASATPEYIIFSTTTKAQAEENISIGFTLDYKKGFDFFIQSDKLNFHTKEIKNLPIALKKYIEISEYLKEKTPQLRQEFDLIVNNIINDVNDNKIKYDWKESSAFKVGDKVYLPQTQRGKEIRKGMSTPYDEAVARGQNYLFVTDVAFPMISLTDSIENGIESVFNESMDDLALYQEPKPEPQPDLPKEDCEADPTKIVSSQVKRFYDLNKNRIDKLNPKFSCKIIQALVSLSDYESCGRPSRESLPKQKAELLSDIKNFKI
jgi:hypothetical protein